MLEPGHSPVGVVLQTCGVIDGQLLGQVLDQLGWNVQWVGEEHAQMADRDHLHGVAEPVVVAAASRDQPPVLVVQVEEPLHLHTRRRAEPAVALIHHREMKSPTAQHRSLALLSSPMFLHCLVPASIGRTPCRKCWPWPAKPGFNDVQHVSGTLLADRYFADRTDGLRPSPDNSESRDPDTGQGVSLHAADSLGMRRIHDPRIPLNRRAPGYRERKTLVGNLLTQYRA